MYTFEDIIGYETIKGELMQICDMIHNKERYALLGAKLPKGIILYGNPGLGKTLMAKCFVGESGLPSYVVRRNKGTSDFVSEITEVFQKAKEEAPAIVLLDDLDKFANEDENHRDAEEYVAVQAGIDSVKNIEVFVLATVNDIRKLPDSLIRFGRFDRKIEVCTPNLKDATEIIKHYLKDKKVSTEINLEDITMMLKNSSCAELETILNEAAILAAYARRDLISMDDITNAVLRMQYDAPDDFMKISETELETVAMHEAGHLVLCEVLCPGSVGLASLRTSGRNVTRGFIRRCKSFKRRPYLILTALAGKAAVELYYSESCASGCQSDISHAYAEIRMAISESGSCGIGMLDVSNYRFRDASESLNSRNEAVVHAELERYLFKTRDILLKNRTFLEKAAALLLEKKTLLYSDIKGLRECVNITEVVI